jgi:hypothetical protein
LQSEGRLSIASTGKDPATGRLVTHEYTVEGPVMIFLTTTAPDLDEELQNRCLVLTVNEERAQTRAIHELQRRRRTLEGLLAQTERAEILRLHQNAQRLLKRHWVINPYVEQLSFADDKTRTRRDHEKYLTLIEAITLLFQYQRPVKTLTRRGKTLTYIESTLDDVRLAHRLAHEVLGHSLDELAPQTRRLLDFLDALVTQACCHLECFRADYRFNRKQVRDFTGLSDFQLRTHLEKLVSLEYVLVHRGCRGQSFVYELLYDGQGADGRPFLMGLVDPERLAAAAPHEYDSKFEGPTTELEPGNGKFEPPSSPHRAPNEPPLRPVESLESPHPESLVADSWTAEPENAHQGMSGRALSYSQPHHRHIHPLAPTASPASHSTPAADATPGSRPAGGGNGAAHPKATR